MLFTKKFCFVHLFLSKILLDSRCTISCLLTIAMTACSIALSESYLFCSSSLSLWYEILVPIATLLLIYSSIFLTVDWSSIGTSPLWLVSPDDAAFIVEILKSLCASCTCCLVTIGVRCIFAMDSDNLIMASSCLTVIGMPVVFLLSLWSLDCWRSATYKFWSICPASSLTLGKTFCFAYVRYFLNSSIEISA